MREMQLCALNCKMFFDYFIKTETLPVFLFFICFSKEVYCLETEMKDAMFRNDNCYQ